GGEILTTNDLIQNYKSVFQTTETPRVFFAPGRINLIGEHTDYNGGHVFPASISFGTYALGLKRNDQKLRFYSMNFSENGIIECDFGYLDFLKDYYWADFPKCMLKYLIENVLDISTGLDILF